MKAIDTHAHLDHIEDLDQALNEAHAAGVVGIVTVSEGLISSKRNLEIKKSASVLKIYVGLGIHPGTIKSDEVEECIDFIRQNIHEANAIGEIGLDFWYKFATSGIVIYFI